MTWLCISNKLPDDAQVQSFRARWSRWLKKERFSLTAFPVRPTGRPRCVASWLEHGFCLAALLVNVVACILQSLSVGKGSSWGYHSFHKTALKTIQLLCWVATIATIAKQPVHPNS